MGQGYGGCGAQTTGRGVSMGDTGSSEGDAGSLGGSMLSSGAMQTNSAGDSHCYHCGGEDHWANKCPELVEEQQAQLHMMVEASKEEKQEAQTAHQFFHTCMMQGEELLDWQAYLDGCLTVTAFKSKKYLSNIHTVKCGVKINCNAGTMKTNQQGDYGTMSVWFILEDIANKFSMNELEKKYRITYNSWEGYYVVHTPNGPVKFYKDKNGLPYIDLEDLKEDAEALLMQMGSEEAATAFIQTVQQNYEGFTKKEILQAKRQACHGTDWQPKQEQFQGDG
jgi:hypothetical protein